MDEEQTKQTIKNLEKKGYFVEEQPKYKITCENDEDFLIQTNDLDDFYCYSFTKDEEDEVEEFDEPEEDEE